MAHNSRSRAITDHSMFILCLIICTSVSFATSQIISGSQENGISSSCNEACRQSFGGNILGQETRKPNNLGSMVDSCRRGCRFFSIVEIINKSADHQELQKECVENCRDAYLGMNSESQACRKGCDLQKPYKNKYEMEKMHEDQHNSWLPNTQEEDVHPGALYPVMLMHNLYRHMARRVSLSFLTVEDAEGHTGQVVVIQSRPQVMVNLVGDNAGGFRGYLIHGGQSSLADTTEGARNSQLKSARAYGDEVNAAQASTDPSDAIAANNNDWLTCLAQRTGMPRLFLCILMLLSAVSMVWLCMSAAVTAPNQHVRLSINSGDLNYIRTLPEKKGIMAVYPQAAVEARPLPNKVQVNKL